MRQRLKLALYLGFVELLTCYLVVLPVSAFTGAESMTGYVRRATAANITAMMTASRAATLSSIGSAVAASTAGSVGVRMVASSVGWPMLGIAAGMTLAMVYYDSTKVAAIKAAAGTPGDVAIPGYSGTAKMTLYVCPGGHPDCSDGYNQVITAQGPSNCAFTDPFGSMPTGWVKLGAYPNCPPGGTYTHRAKHASSSPSTLATVGPSTPATATGIETYIGGLPAGDSQSIESNTVPVGSQVAPTPADSTSAIAVPSAGLATDVVPTSQVAPTDTVINPNATPPAGTQTTKPASQTTDTTATKTTTTTTNPDGSVTQTSTETAADTATVTCSAGNHEQRSFGGILQAHMDLWAGSGLLSALNLLKNLTWPSAIPSFALSSTLFGNFTLDFSAWAGMLTALRSIIIAIAGFVAYRIVFVGST